MVYTCERNIYKLYLKLSNMGFFSKNQEELSKIIVTINGIGARIDKLEQQIELIKTNSNSLRGLINRKIGYTEQEEEQVKEKDPYGIFK